jgi:hypothetical protein
MSPIPASVADFRFFLKASSVMSTTGDALLPPSQALKARFAISGFAWQTELAAQGPATLLFPANGWLVFAKSSTSRGGVGSGKMSLLVFAAERSGVSPTAARGRGFEGPLSSL